MTAVRLAENDRWACDFLADLLESEFGAVVERVWSGTLAAAAIETGSFDLAIIDMSMSEISRIM